MLIIDENPELEFSEEGLDSYFVRFNTTKQERQRLLMSDWSNKYKDLDQIDELEEEESELFTPNKVAMQSAVRTPANKETMTVYKQSLMLMTKNVETDYKKS